MVKWLRIRNRQICIGIDRIKGFIFWFEIREGSINFNIGFYPIELFITIYPREVNNHSLGDHNAC